MTVIQRLKNDFINLGIKEGDSVMMHCSYKALGEKVAPEDFFAALSEVLGEDGTLILPAFSYRTVTYDEPVFDKEATPSCVGFLPEWFRTEIKGVKRSLHATHSCTAVGKNADYFIKNHELDATPVGENSPIAKLPLMDGKILILGSHPDHNTTLHGVEEKAEAPYIFDKTKTVNYVLKDGEKELVRPSFRHDFHKKGFYYDQKYGRILDLLDKEDYSFGSVLKADCYLMSAKAVWEKGVEKLRSDPYFFVEKVCE